MEVFLPKTKDIDQNNNSNNFLSRGTGSPINLTDYIHKRKRVKSRSRSRSGSKSQDSKNKRHNAKEHRNPIKILQEFIKSLNHLLAHSHKVPNIIDELSIMQQILLSSLLLIQQNQQLLMQTQSLNQQQQQLQASLQAFAGSNMTKIPNTFSLLNNNSRSQVPQKTSDYSQYLQNFKRDKLNLNLIQAAPTQTNTQINQDKNYIKPATTTTQQLFQKPKIPQSIASSSIQPLRNSNYFQNKYSTAKQNYQKPTKTINIQNSLNNNKIQQQQQQQQQQQAGLISQGNLILKDQKLQPPKLVSLEQMVKEKMNAIQAESKTNNNISNIQGIQFQQSKINETSNKKSQSSDSSISSSDRNKQQPQINDMSQHQHQVKDNIQNSYNYPHHIHSENKGIFKDQEDIQRYYYQQQQQQQQQQIQIPNQRNISRIDEYTPIVMNNQLKEDNYLNQGSNLHIVQPGLSKSTKKNVQQFFEQQNNQDQSQPILQIQNEQQSIYDRSCLLVGVPLDYTTQDIIEYLQREQIASLIQVDTLAHYGLEYLRLTFESESATEQLLLMQPPIRDTPILYLPYLEDCDPLQMLLNHQLHVKVVPKCIDQIDLYSILMKYGKVIDIFNENQEEQQEQSLYIVTFAHQGLPARLENQNLKHPYTDQEVIMSFYSTLSPLPIKRKIYSDTIHALYYKSIASKANEFGLSNTISNQGRSQPLVNITNSNTIDLKNRKYLQAGEYNPDIYQQYYYYSKQLAQEPIYDLYTQQSILGQMNANTNLVQPTSRYYDNEENYIMQQYYTNQQQQTHF